LKTGRPKGLVSSNLTPSAPIVERPQEVDCITVSHNKSADFRRYSTLLVEVFSDKETGGEEGIHVDGSVGETTGLRWLARATSGSAPVATTGNVVLPCRAIGSEAPGGGPSPGEQRITRDRQGAGKNFSQKKGR
jgi:hypothetical protein